MSKYEKDNYPSADQSTQEGIMIPARYAGLLVASVVVILVSIFMGGYFLGKKHALEETFCRSTERDSLADQIFVALCGAADSKDAHQSTNTDELDEVVEEQETTVLVAGDSTAMAQSSNISSDAPTITPEEASEQPDLSSSENKTPCYAELIGFGSLSGAERFAERVRTKNHIPVSVKKRTSKTAKGRTVTWYQVVTGSYAEEQELVALVNIVKQQERLSDVRIVHCRG